MRDARQHSKRLECSRTTDRADGPGRRCESTSNVQRLGGLDVLVLLENADRRMLTEDRIFGDENLFDLLLRGRVIHDVQHDLFQYRAQSPGSGFLRECLPRHRSQGALSESQLHLLERKQFLVLLGEGISRLSQNLDQCAFIKFIKGGHYGETADELRNETVFQKILWLYPLEQFAQPHVRPPADFCAESHGFSIQTLLDDLFESDKRPTANKED